MATIYRRGKSWVLQYYDGGDRIRKSLGPVSKHLAEQARRKKESELNYKKYEIASGIKLSNTNKIKFNEYAEQDIQWYEKRFPDSFSTMLGNTKNYLIPFFKDTLLHKITRQDIELFTEEILEESKASTVNRILSTLRAMLNRARSNDYIVADLKIKEVPDNEDKPIKFYNKDELQKIYDKDSEFAYWWKFLANTGLRLSDFYYLKTENIKKDQVHVVSKYKARTKNRKYRIIPLSEGALTALKDFDLTQEYLIPRVHKDTVKKRFSRVCKKIGFEKGKTGIHCLRHTFASHLIMEGKPVMMVKDIMGHAKLETTMKYVHLQPNYLKEAVEGFNI